MSATRKVDYWVWPDPPMEGRPMRWCFRSARFHFGAGSGYHVMDMNSDSREAAMRKARRQLREYGYGGRLIDAPDMLGTSPTAPSGPHYRGVKIWSR